MIIISDTSPITSLLKINKIEVLEKIFKKVIIPEAVHNELKLTHLEIPAFISTQHVKNKEYVNALLSELDTGEAEAIALAKELNAELLLIDEHLGREIAEREGIQIIGLLGVFLIAKKRGIINSIKKIISLLESEANFWLSDSLKNEVYKLAGEN